MPRVFGAAATEYFRIYGGGVECLAKMGKSLELELEQGVWGMVIAKNHRLALNNPYGQFRVGYTEAEILTSPRITNEHTKLMCSPTSVE
jgi:sterol carrier protein 2